MAIPIDSKNNINKEDHINNCPFYCPKTGIYSSRHKNIHLPTDPFVDIVSHILSYLQNNITNNNDKPAFIDPSTGTCIPFSHLTKLIKSTAFRLSEMGISQGDVVLILLPNSIYFPVLLLGILYLGAVVTPMNPLSSFSEVKKLTVNLNVAMTFCLSENAVKFRGLGLRVIAVPERLELCKKDGIFNEFYMLLHGNIGIVDVPRCRIKQDDTAAILYSSGTTGVSKGVVLTHRNFIAMVELFVRFEASQYEENSCENVNLAILPMFHIYGLSLFVMGLVTLGGSTVVMTKFDVDEVVSVIDKYRVTHFPVVPPVLPALTRKGKCIGVVSGLGSLKQISCGAAPVSNKVIEDFVQTFPGVDLIQGYGMTESTAVGTRGFNFGNVLKYNSVGLLAPNTEAKVVNWVTGSYIPPGKAGELLLRGPGVMKGYLNNREATRLIIEEDGWLHTGDIAYFDHDGYLYILERLKEIIKYKGYQIAPADLEAVLISHPEIIDVAVTAAADEEAGEIPVAFVVKKQGSSITRDDVIKYVAKEVAPYKKVREVVFVASIPKSPAGKLLRRQLKNLVTSKL